MSDLGYIQSSPKKNYTGVKTIRSLTIKQILESEKEESSTVNYINKVELSTFKVIGWVSNVKTTSTGKAFLLEDSTGVIDCILWSNKTYEEYMVSLIEDGLLIKVTGMIKEYSNRKSINVSSMYIIEDYNELTYHMTSALREYLFYTKSTQKKEVKRDMQKIHKDLLECIRNNQDDEDGIPLDIVVKCMQNEYTERLIKEGVDFLVDNFYLMSTGGGYKCIN